LWFDAARAARETALEAALRIFRGAPLPETACIHIWESLELTATIPLTDPGTGRCEVVLPAKGIHFQHRPVPRESFPLPPRIRRPLSRSRRLPPDQGQRVLDVALTALCSRNLEIYPLVYADPHDVTRTDVGRGVSIVITGIKPEFRSVPESDLFFVIVKNGIPVAYGPASVFLGCCEMGVNLFPEFRGGEIRFLYAQLLRCLHHLAGAQYFFLVAYGMGEDNPEALKSGAFWFYRRLGFRAANPDVEALAQAEEAIMARRPGHRSDLATLRKLSHTEAYLDLSRRKCRPIDMGRLGRAVTHLVTTEYGGDREAAMHGTARRMIDVLEIRDHAKWGPHEKEALRRMGPVAALVPDLTDWQRRERAGFVAWIRAKGAGSELACAKLGSAHRRLAEGLRRGTAGS